jgi:tetratricopeptide (TPR) repeat protein
VFLSGALWVGVIACATGGPETDPVAGASAVDTATATFVGRQACTACHEAQDERWRGSHHDLAMQAANEQTVLGDFDDASFLHLGTTTRFFRRDTELWVETEGPEGERVEYKIAYTFGVEPLQQYLVEFPDGRRQALDVAWDSTPKDDGGQRWFHLQPEQRYEPGDPMHWTGVAYTWNYMCAECHSTDLRKNYDAASDTYNTAYSDIDVSCEACHGPGSMHVEWAEAWAAAAPQGASIPPARAAGMSAAQMGLQVEFPRIVDHSWDIDPETGLAQRNPERAPGYDVEICGRCHARRGVIHDDYRYGRPVTDFYRVALLEEGLYHADGQILDEVFVYGSFLQSRMYQKGVACGDCHEPHGLKLYNEGNALCSRCHLGEKFDTPEHHHHEVGTAGASCVECHMPATTYMVVDPRRDHSFRSPRPDLSLTYGTPNACADCHVDRGDRWSADAVQRWFGPERPASYGELLASGRGRGPRAELDLRTLAADNEAPGIVRGTALSLLPVTSQASINVIVAALGIADPMIRAGALAALEGADPATRMRLGLPMLDDGSRSVRLEAARLIATLPMQQIPPPQRGAVNDALDEYRAAQRVSEDRAQAHLNLGWLALQQGDMATAEQEYLTAMRLESMFVPTFVNLADLYRLTGRDAEGEGLLRQALQIAPDSGDAYYALGLLLVRADRLDEAVAALRRASRLAAGNPHYVYVHAVAVQTAGDADAAVQILDEGLARFPADRELLFGAAAFSRDLGELERAIGYARRLVDVAPNDAQAAAFLRDLEGRRSGP